jgi:hypothetical protein
MSMAQVKLDIEYTSFLIYMQYSPFKSLLPSKYLGNPRISVSTPLESVLMSNIDFGHLLVSAFSVHARTGKKSQRTRER